MRKTKTGSQSLWILLTLLVVFFFFMLLYTMQRTAKSEEKNFDGSLIKFFVSQNSFMAKNRKNESMGVMIQPGQSIQGFTVFGTYYTEEESWSNKKILKEQKYMFYVMPTVSNPPFFIALPDIQNEGVSKDIYDDGMFEAETHYLFEHILLGPDGCRNSISNNGEPPLVLDVGANLGWFTSYSAAAGCRVIGVEPQPRMLTLINVTLELNEFQSRLGNYNNEEANRKYPTMKDRVKILNNIVNTDSSKLKIIYDNGACWACSIVKPASENEKSSGDSFIIPSIRLDSVIKEDLLLMKIDIEGYEVRGLESAFSSLQKYNVKNILVEWTPRRWHSLHNVDRGTQILEQLYDLGYSIFHYNLRMEYPKEGLESINYQHGSAWKIPRSKLAHLNDFLTKAGYGEANL